MIKVTNAQMWVLDQEESLAFYTEKLGWEVRSDVTLPEMGDFRWLTVAPPEQENFELVLMEIPGPPVFEEETANMIREVVARGVEFIDAPEERPYGIDSGFRDPSGNALRLTQVDEAVVNQS